MYRIAKRIAAIVIFGLVSTQTLCMLEEQKELAQLKQSAARARTKRQQVTNPAILVKRGRKMQDKPAQADPNLEISNVPAETVLSGLYADANDCAKTLSITYTNKQHHSGGILKVREKRIREEPRVMTRSELLERLEQIGIRGPVDVEDLASLKKTFDQSQDVNYRAAKSYEIGTLYALGRDGAEKNFSQALEWFKKAIETTYEPVRVGALIRIYEIYNTGGFGVEKSPADAMAYLRRAASISQKAAILFSERFPSESQKPPC